jgi:hypothetical protein
MKVPLRVHIIPIGDDKLERIIKPPIEDKADRVYLISMEGQDLYRSMLEGAERVLKEYGKEVEIEYCDLTDYESILKVFASIIKKEQDQRHIIYLSISTGGNMAAAASITASMLFGGHPYFTKQDFSKNILSSPVPIPRLNFSPPERHLIRFLHEMAFFFIQHQVAEISKHECLQLMVKIHPDESLSHTSGDYNKLKFRYLDALEKLKYICIDPKPRGKVQITAEGHLILQLYQKYYGFTEHQILK